MSIQASPASCWTAWPWSAPPRRPEQRVVLSEREREVLQLMTQGFTNADIARQLYLSEGTVRNYASEIFRKMGVSDRTQAVVFGLRHGLVDLE